MVGIVGRSGSGKSTLVNLLARFHDVQQGSVEIDGIDVRQLAGRQLRERLGIVLQESFLFRGTIWKNLGYGRPEATIEEGLANVVSYCTHGITNAVAEGINSKIMAIKRRVGGYRNRENFKTAIYFYCGGLELYPH